MVFFDFFQCTPDYRLESERNNCVNDSVIVGLMYKRRICCEGASEIDLSCNGVEVNDSLTLALFWHKFQVFV